MNRAAKQYCFPFSGFFSRYAETRVHLRNVKKDLLLALRSIIDAEIKKTEEKSSGSGEERAERVEIT